MSVWALDQVFAATWTIDEARVAAFLRCSGDTNPVHVDDAFAQARGYRARLVHGALLQALVSGFVGTGLPVKDTLCLMQKLSNRQPVYVGDEVTLTARVTAVQPAPTDPQRVCVAFDLVFRRGPEIVANGELQILAGDA